MSPATETTLPAAVLWDMDGTLIDTEPYWFTAETELVHSFGHDWSADDSLATVGLGLLDAAAFLQRGGVDLEPEEIVRRMVARVVELLGEQGLPWRPGARELLLALREAGVRTALVTMSVRSLADTIVANLGFDGFELVVGGDEVTQAKPHPEPYLHAARVLGVDIADCVVIEDSIPGATAGFASGAATIAVPHHIAVPAELAHAVWDTLEGVAPVDLGSLLASVRERASTEISA